MTPVILLQSTTTDHLNINGTDYVFLIVGKAKIVEDTVAGSYVNSNTWYLYIFLLLAGVIAGLLLFIALFLFCRFCRHKNNDSQVTVRVDDSARYDHDPTNFAIAENNNNPARDAEEAGFTFPCDSNALCRISPPELHRYNGSPDNDELEEALVISNGVSPLRQGDEHGKSCLVLQKQKSFVKETSPPANNKQLQSNVGCEVAVDVHTGGGGGIASGLHTLQTSSRQQHSPECRSWAGTDDEREADIELVKTRGKGEVEPHRASSTDWTRLESSLDFWQQKHSRSRPLLEDERRCKVRYNDTGSLEEVNVVNVVDYFVEDELMIDLEADRESVRQYRKLWQLRTTLEIDEGRKVPPPPIAASAPSTSGTGRRLSSTLTPIIVEQQLQSQSSPELSPDRGEMQTSGSHTTSFDSTTEPLIEETVGAKMPASTAPNPPHPHSYEARRQTYRNMLSWRLQPTVLESRSLRHPHTRQAPIEDNSFDSADTEGSSTTDPSRIEQVNTSFESTTDTGGGNTDSAGDFQHQHQLQQHRHNLVQQRTDSGYRSLDYPGQTPISKMMYMSAEMVRHSIPSVGESVEEASEGEFASIDVEDEGVGGLMYAGASRRASGHTASKKRRDFGRMSDYPRDYSVDEKSDALFREFSRCDTPVNQQQKLRDYRRYRQPSYYPQSKLNFRSEDDYGLYVDDEICFSSVPIIRVAPEEDQDLSDKL